MIYIIKVICAWCGREIGQKESLFPGDTHTVCENCMAEQNRLLAVLLEGQEGEPIKAIPFNGEPMPNKERTMQEFYGLGG